MDMNREEMLAQFEALRLQTEHPEAWVDSFHGADLWVDGLNVYLTVERDDFIQALEQFQENYSYTSHSKTGCLSALHEYCLDAAKQGEFELYQALSVGMTWLSLQAETQGHFFNIPAVVANHSLALLLSKTYQAIWVLSHNAGLGLYIDLERKSFSTFRPEHGRVYQDSRSHIKGEIVKYPFQYVAHEMAHMLLQADLYSRPLGDSPAENASYLLHMEAVISCVGELIQQEIMSVRDDLNVISDAFVFENTFHEYGAITCRVLGGKEPNLTYDSLARYRKRFIHLGDGEERSLPDSPVKLRAIEAHPVTELEERLIAPEYQRYMLDQQLHISWGLNAGIRNRICTYREVFDLLPVDAYCAEKLEESFDCMAWTDYKKIFSIDALPELDSEQRRRNVQLWVWRELFQRIAEVRGFLEVETGDVDSPLQRQFFAIAQKLALLIEKRREQPYSVAEHESMEQEIREEIRTNLLQIERTDLKEKALEMLHDPYTYLLLPY
jgi:hypothetical protein